MLTKELISKLFESDVKVEAGLWVQGVPEFGDCQGDPRDWERMYQDHYKKEIGSFLQALDMVGERCCSVLSPHWYKKFKWTDIHTICHNSSISYDVFIHLSENEQFEWHLDADITRPRPIGDLNQTGFS